jgi:DNA-binding CsgD family transcriptional regulator
VVADLLVHPLTEWPGERVALQLVETFAANGCAWSVSVTGGDVQGALWPRERYAARFDEMLHWSTVEAPTKHPVLRYYLATGDGQVMQACDVPERIADARVQAAWAEVGRDWGGVQSQLAIPLRLDRGGHRAFVLGRADRFTEREVALARRLRPLLVAVDRQVEVLDAWSARTDEYALQVVEDVGLTSRELAVLRLLGEGLTAVSIARRLAISEGTVHKRLERVYTKLGVTDRLGAVLRAQAVGLLLPPTRIRRRAHQTGPGGDPQYALLPIHRR